MSGHSWPLFDLRLGTPRLELRFPNDADLLELMAIARAGVVEPGHDFFIVPWHELPSPAFERQFLLHWWRSRGTWAPQNWVLGLAVVADGRPIGMQAVSARDFAVRRTVVTGSWLGLPHQGRGYGTEMRAAVLALAFDGLGALVAQSGHFPGNAASARISEKMGYETDGSEVYNVSGRRLEETRLRVTREKWRRDSVPVSIEGLEPCLGLFGAIELSPEEWPSI
jgi:RimJ/RimL family protein N-acetyltransferase